MFIRDYYYKVNDDKFDVEEVIEGHMDNYFRDEIKKLKEVRGSCVNSGKNGSGKGDLIENSGSEATLMNLPLAHRSWM